MSTEKLSELSKPVAWASQRHIDTRHRISAFTDEESARGEGWQKVAPLYSQDYVSALLADNEKKEKLLISNAVEYEISTTDLLAELEAKDKRIAELSRLLAHNIDRAESAEKLLEDRLEKWQELASNQCIKINELQDKLATPVRLSDTTHPRCRQQLAEDIRAAGFAVEGDE